MVARPFKLLAMLFVIALAVVPPVVLPYFVVDAHYERVARALTGNSLAIVPGAVLAFFWFMSICALADQARPFDTQIDVPFGMTGLLMGAVERYFFGVAVALDISGVLTGMIIWTVLKAQSHWNLFSASRPQGLSVKSAYIGMFGSIFSMLLAAIVGYLSRLPSQ